MDKHIGENSSRSALPKMDSSRCSCLSLYISLYFSLSLFGQEVSNQDLLKVESQIITPTSTCRNSRALLPITAENKEPRSKLRETKLPVKFVNNEVFISCKLSSCLFCCSSARCLRAASVSSYSKPSCQQRSQK